MYTMNGAELIITLLEREGIHTVAGIPGGSNLPLYDALYHSTKIKHVLARHEQGACFIAHGIARSTGRPGVCFATSGPGATNLLTAIADAYLDSVPIVCITGQVSRNLLGKNSFQEIDICSMVAPAAKRTFRLKNASELLSIIPEAFETAVSGRPGPVLIDIPKDVQQEMLSFEAFPKRTERTAPSHIDTEQIKKAAHMIRNAQRPIICGGGGVVHSGASTLMRALAERCDIPVTTTLMGLGTFPSLHPLSLGMLGMHGSAATNSAVHHCDLFIALGKRFNDRTTGNTALFCKDAAVIHVDIDPQELGKNRTPDIGICGDIKDIMSALLAELSPMKHDMWRQEIRTWQGIFAKPIHAGHPHSIITRIANMIPPDTIITTDVGQHQMWVAQSYPFSFTRQLLTSGGLGTMGFGLPAAIGASLAHPGRTIVNFTGDGSLLMNLQELVTAVEEHLNIKIIVFNNRSLGLVHQQQDLFYGKRHIACDFEHTPDMPGLARACGMTAIDITGPELLEEALRTALAVHGPCLINMHLDKYAHVLPMVPPGKGNHEMLL